MVVVHLTGMGWMGTILARHLHEAGIAFTWSDIDSEHVAWRASNGLVGPDGDERSIRNARIWSDWHNRGLLGNHSEQATYVYAHKTPPHGGRYKPVLLSNGLHRAPEPVIVVNVPDAVMAARAEFAASRRPGPPEDALNIITHGFSDRFHRAVWGWTADATLNLPPELAALGTLDLYGRANRFEVVHATARAGRPGWYRIGTTLSAKTPTNPDETAMRALLKRAAMLPELFPGVTIDTVSSPVNGWRPLPQDMSADPVIRKTGNTWTLPPLGHSGVRWCPEVIETVMEDLRS